MPILVHGQGIDGKISPSQVFFQGITVPDLSRPMDIFLAIRFVPIGGHFHPVTVHPQDHHTKILAQFTDHRDLCCCGSLFDFFRAGIGHHIIIIRDPSQQHIPYGPSHHIGFKALVQKYIHDFFHIGRDTQFHSPASSLLDGS